MADLFATAAQLDVGPSGIVDLLGAVLASRPPWHRDALCQEHPRVDFFPGKGGDVRPAKRVCSGCLVKVECRAWALKQGPELDGIWAGTTKAQRTQMRRATPPELRPLRPPRTRVPSRVQQERGRRPTGLMDRVSAFLAAHPDDDQTAMAINQAVTGDSQAIGRALAALTEEGYVSLTIGGIDARGCHNPRRRAYRHLRRFTIAAEPAGPESATVVVTDPATAA